MCNIYKQNCWWFDKHARQKEVVFTCQKSVWLERISQQAHLVKQINVYTLANTRTSEYLENIPNENKTIKSSTMRLNSTGIMRKITKLTGTRHTINKREESKKSPTCIERKANEMSAFFFLRIYFRWCYFDARERCIRQICTRQTKCL